MGNELDRHEVHGASDRAFRPCGGAIRNCVCRHVCLVAGYAPVAAFPAFLADDGNGVVPDHRISVPGTIRVDRSEEHTSELQSLMRISYAVFCLKKKTLHNTSN